MSGDKTKDVFVLVAFEKCFVQTDYSPFEIGDGVIPRFEIGRRMSILAASDDPYALIRALGKIKEDSTLIVSDWDVVRVPFIESQEVEPWS